MTTITTRSGKGSALTHQELDDNFTNLNTDKLEATGNVTQSGNVSVVGTVTAATVTALGNVSAGNVLTGGSITATGNITANNIGNIAALNLNGNASQVLYGNGVFAAVAGGGSGSPGGSDSQIQYNDGGSFGGNVALTFNDTTGTITLGNITVNTRNIKTDNIDLANATANGVSTPWRIMIGNGYQGSANTAYDLLQAGTITSSLGTPRVLIADTQEMPNTGVRGTQLTNYLWAIQSANISNTTQRVTACRNYVAWGGGANAYVYTGANAVFHIQGVSTQVQLGAGTNANLSALGNANTTSGAIASFNGVGVSAYSTANTIVGVYSQLTPQNPNVSAFGNATTCINYFAVIQSAPANANVTGTTTAVGYYVPPSTGFAGTAIATQSQGNIARQATNYHAFRNDDDLAKSRLGSLERFHEFTSNVTISSGNITVDKTAGQVQQVYMTSNVGNITFTNFVTRTQKPDTTQVNQTDTVTLIVQQGATPYTLTLPTGNANIRYAGGVSTVPSTANTTVLISVTGVYNYNTTSVNYLVTVSPEFQ